ncbi:hypothetical protein D3OALGA1CA_5022 [Olavius algarvensis associated proteobacterium Delta 3]|nr:hypothetical protein D3OALGA1CA_5022 [Olavius algarvensis associated proteobacterium Delta 3]
MGIQPMDKSSDRTPDSETGDPIIGDFCAGLLERRELVEIIDQDRRSGKDRRTGFDRRKTDESPPGDMERRSGNERRSNQDRRKQSDRRDHKRTIIVV